MAISSRRGGPADDGPLLVLVHGLGATYRVWDGLTATLDPSWSWVAPDLPGHGDSAPLEERYSFGGLAGALAEILDDRPVVILGHSLGGVVGLELAGGQYGVDVTGVCGLGIKVRWTDAELAKAAELAARPAKVFGTRAEAVDRALRVAGLTGLVDPDSPVATSCVTETDGGWRLALDSGAFAVGRPGMKALLASAQAPVVLAAGEHDPMSPVEHLRELVPDPVILPGVGHNAQVEQPSALVPILERIRPDPGN
ncbi:MAG TPA: alpha/beta hydrolase [Nocardioidaceae bacterium]|nr:alpha/beta hydrolase [Nocardioidaceae bacterium]